MDAVTDSQQLARLRIEGMTCTACSARLERVLGRTDGVLSAQVDFASETATVAFQGAPDLPAAVRKAGFEAHPAASDAQQRAEEDARQARTLRRDLALLGLSVALTLPLVAPMVLPVPMAPGWLQAALATVVQGLVGARFYRGAFTALRHGSANMDVLVALGTTAAWGLSSYLLATGDAHLYYEASASVLTLVLLGKHLEARARRATTDALRALTALRPERARLERGDGVVEVPPESVAAGQIVQVLPGERVPVDGEVVEGHSPVDESLLTGESMPVEKAPGSAVTGGSLNGSGRLRVKTSRTGSASSLARIIALVQHAQSRKPAIQAAVDRVSGVFVPAVLVIALLTLVGWSLVAPWDQAILRAVAVLVIACPCALGLATPAALIAGTGAAARAGILIRDADVLERAEGIEVVVFDKTGTLTQGQPRVLERELPEDALRLAAGAQKASEHPLAQAILDAYPGEAPSPMDAKALPGRGLQASVEGQEVLVGSPRLMRERGLPHDAMPGLTTVHVAVDGAYKGRLGIGDSARPEAREALDALGVDTVLLTGDSADAAQKLAEGLGLMEVHAEVLPQDKAAHIEGLVAAGRQVAMVGDGVNDAPALAAATMGIAMGGGSDVAVHTADITLMRDDLRLVPAALDIARATRRTIRQNLFWAFIYNSVGIPLAVAGLLSPAVAGGAMALSSVSVLLNALRLRRWSP